MISRALANGQASIKACETIESDNRIFEKMPGKNRDSLEPVRWRNGALEAIGPDETAGKAGLCLHGGQWTKSVRRLHDESARCNL